MSEEQREDEDFVESVQSFIEAYKRTFLYLKVCMTIIVLVQLLILIR